MKREAWNSGIILAPILKTIITISDSERSWHHAHSDTRTEALIHLCTYSEFSLRATLVSSSSPKGGTPLHCSSREPFALQDTLFTFFLFLSRDHAEECALLPAPRCPTCAALPHTRRAGKTMRESRVFYFLGEQGTFFQRGIHHTVTIKNLRRTKMSVQASKRVSFFFFLFTVGTVTLGQSHLYIQNSSKTAEVEWYSPLSDPPPPPIQKVQ